MTAANHDFVRENMAAKRFRAELAAKDFQHGNRMGVSDPLGAAFLQTDGVQKRFHRGQFGLFVHAAGFENLADFVVGFVRLIQRLGKSATVSRG